MPVISTVTANICCNPVRSTRAFTARMKQAARLTGAVFGQEIQIPSYDSAWNHAMARRGRKTFGQAGECPISIPDSVWGDFHSSVLYVHGGLRKVSPNRVITKASSVRETGERVIWMNCHPVSKPFSRLPIRGRAWRNDHWNLYFETLREQVAAYHDAGWTVIFGGDMNRRRMPVVHEDQRVLHHSGYDWLWVVPAEGYVASAVKRKTIRRTALMDHPILAASFMLSRKATR